MTKSTEDRPPIAFSEEVADQICDRLADGMSLREVCRAADMPSRETVRRWLRSNPEFRKQYDKALIERTDAQLEEIQEIADDATNDWMDRRRADGSTERVPDPETVARSKLRIYARQWAMAKMQPRKYGDKVAVGGDPDAPPIQIDAVSTARRLAFILEKGARERVGTQRPVDTDQPDRNR